MEELTNIKECTITKPPPSPLLPTNQLHEHPDGSATNELLMVSSPLPPLSSHGHQLPPMSVSSTEKGNDVSHGDDEKCDVDPENSRKSCDVTPDTADDISFTDNAGSGGIGADPEIPEISDMTNCDKDHQVDPNVETKEKAIMELSKSALAYTIDFNDGKPVDSKKYNSIFERFQKRHRRGVSLSKLDDRVTGTASSATIMNTKPPLKKGSHITKSQHSSIDVAAADEKIILRDKSRLSNRVRDDQRYSWSPRSSGIRCDEMSQSLEVKRPTKLEISAIGIVSAPRPPTSPQLPVAEDLILCNAPPLVFRRESLNNKEHDDGSLSSVSDAGTYTLDGDNYTEEQKALMSIDKLAKLTRESSGSTSANYLRHEAATEVIDLESIAATLEKPKKVKTSYLDRIKSKVKTISDRTFHKNRSPPIGHDRSASPQLATTPPPLAKPLDVGSFTSITASGVFSKLSLPPKAELRRKNSLTKSQIDSSEYIQKIDEKLLNSFTDSEKAQHNDYQLNIFSMPQQPHTNNNERIVMSTSASYGIERAETKNDWIQEWAKNARRNTKKNSTSSCRNSCERSFNGTDYSNQQELQQKPFTTGYHHHQEEFGDNLDRNYSQRKNINRYDDTANTRCLDDDLLDQYELRPNSGNNRRRNVATIDMMAKSVASDFGDDIEDDLSLASSYHRSSQNDRLRREFFSNNNNAVLRPPISPTKIPSPMHSMVRPRSSSISNRSVHNSVTDLDKHDTEMYLQKTAAAISTLQNIHRSNNSPQNPSSPAKQNSVTSILTSSPSIRRHKAHLLAKQSPTHQNYTTFNQNNTHYNVDHLYSSSASLHKRNLSLDGTEIQPKLLNKDNMFHSYNSDGLDVLLKVNYHSRHNSYEDKPSPTRAAAAAQRFNIDQTFAPQIMQRTHISTSSSSIKQQQTPPQQQTSAPSQRSDINRPKISAVVSTPSQSQIKRSSSFSTKSFVRPSSAGGCATKTLTPKMAPKSAKTSLQKSASSTSFKNMSKTLETDIYLNDTDDLYATTGSYESEQSDAETTGDDSNDKELISNTRYNKAFLIRVEQNKQKSVLGQKNQGVSACPNTPEMPRRDVRARQSLRDRASMPRDSSINRLKQDIPAFNATKKVLAAPVSQPPVTAGSPVTVAKDKDQNRSKVLPKYLDISKYKPSQGNTFLKRDESKSTLINKEIKRSSSAFLNKSDVGRSSVRSVKSATNNKSSPAAAISAANREAELAMWRRRASYDPMKAAAEGKKKQEAKRVAHASKYNDSSTIVLRSQSFHSGVGGQSSNLSSSDSMDAINTRWTLISTESSDEEFGEN